ncbi:unnamed protein product, partial [Ascophyllum nodosum]
KKRKNFSKEEAHAVIRWLLTHSDKGVIKHGAYTSAAEKFGCEYRTIKRLWKKYKDQNEQGVLSPELGNKRKENAGRKGIPLVDLKQQLHDIPLGERTTQRRLAASFGIPQSTLHRNLKALGLRPYSSALKP